MPASVRGKDSVAHAKWQYAEDQTHNGSASKAILGIEVSRHWWLFCFKPTNAQFKFRAKSQKFEVELAVDDVDPEHWLVFLDSLLLKFLRRSRGIVVTPKPLHRLWQLCITV